VSRTFVDTSAILALLANTDPDHERARAAFEKLRVGEERLVTTQYVLVETYALIKSRLGGDAVAAFREHFAPLVEVLTVDEAAHERALDRMVTDESDALSLVDAVSFVVMREQKIERAFAFDGDFAAEGFETLG
jgi:predicted nucleic acid-binding protein